VKSRKTPASGDPKLGLRAKSRKTPASGDPKLGLRARRLIKCAKDSGHYRLRQIAGTAWSTKRYLNIQLLKDQQIEGAITA
jgi:hypothetical protein